MQQYATNQIELNVPVCIKLNLPVCTPQERQICEFSLSPQCWRIIEIQPSPRQIMVMETNDFVNISKYSTPIWRERSCEGGRWSNLRKCQCRNECLETRYWNIGLAQQPRQSDQPEPELSREKRLHPSIHPSIQLRILDILEYLYKH